MIVIPEYRGHRVEVNAAAFDGRHNAEVRIPGCSLGRSRTSRS